VSSVTAILIELRPNQQIWIKNQLE